MLSGMRKMDSLRGSELGGVCNKGRQDSVSTEVAASERFPSRVNDEAHIGNRKGRKTIS